jgi:hypothetical protein
MDEMTTENQANNYFNCVDLIKTLSANNALGLQRVHDGTDNEDTVADLLQDIIHNLYIRRGLDKSDWEQLLYDIEVLLKKELRNATDT